MMSPARTDAPLVSVITPFLNADRFLAAAIESVRAQTYPNWELLLVNDGSTDASGEIAERYAARHADRIRCLTHPDRGSRGASAARNLGARHAQGDCMAYLDADDVWLPDRLEHQVRLLRAHPEAGMVIGASQYWYGWTGKPEDMTQDVVRRIGAPSECLVQPPELLLMLYPLGKGTAPVPNAILVRREVVERVGGWEEQFVKFYTDQAFLIKIYLSTSIYVSDQCCDRYRQHRDSSMAMTLRDKQYHVVRRAFLTWLDGFLECQGNPDPRVRRALDRAFWRYRHPRLSHALELPLGLAKGALQRSLPNVYGRLRSRWHAVRADGPVSRGRRGE